MKKPSGKQAGPKYERVREKLREAILSGDYPPGVCLPSEMELAKRYRVGRQTLLHALMDLVREGLIVRRRGSGSYVADRRSPPLIPGRNLKFGICWGHSLDPQKLLTDFKGLLTRGALSAWGLKEVQPEWPRVDDHAATRAVWTSSSQGLTVVALGESRFAQVRHPPLRELKREQLDGILCMAIIEPGWLSQVLGLGIPTVLVDHFDERFSLLADQVFADPQVGYRQAVQQLAGQGCKSIHFIAGFISIPAPSPEMSPAQVAAYRGTKMRVNPDSYLRLSAFRQALDGCGLPCRDEQIHFPNPMECSNADFARRLLALPVEIRPDAVVCHDIGQTDGLMEEFAKLGQPLRGAGAVAFGYGGPSIPILSDCAEMGAVGAELLLSRLQRPSRRPLNVGVPMTSQTSGVLDPSLKETARENESITPV